MILGALCRVYGIWGQSQVTGITIAVVLWIKGRLQLWCSTSCMLSKLSCPTQEKHPFCQNHSTSATWGDVDESVFFWSSARRTWRLHFKFLVSFCQGNYPNKQRRFLSDYVLSTWWLWNQGIFKEFCLVTNSHKQYYSTPKLTISF